MTKLKYIEKALLIGFVIAILFSFTSFTAFAAQCEQIPNEVFRLHVLANSDSEEDQALKLKVRGFWTKRENCSANVQPKKKQ